jgi:hypothetical protein
MNMRNFLLALIFVPNLIFTQVNPKVFKGVEKFYPKTLPIHLHILTDKFGQTNVQMVNLNLMLNRLNEYFAPIGVDFEFCAIDTILNNRLDSVNLTEKDLELVTKFNVKNKINLYLVADYLLSPLPCGSATLGDTIVPLEDEFRDAIFLNKPCVLQPRNIARLMGRYLGLNLTMGDGQELVNGSNCLTAGDRICDTAADPGVLLDANCNLVGNPSDTNGDFYTPDICNLMSMYNVNCKYHFSVQQYNRMVDVLKKGRNYLW